MHLESYNKNYLIKQFYKVVTKLGKERKKR